MDKIETKILTTRPSFKTIGFGLVGTMFFGAFAYLMLTLKWTVAEGTDYKTGMVAMWVIFGIFIFFSTASFLTILGLKVIVLTDKNLIIKRPLLLFRLTIPLINIKSIIEKDYQINTRHDFTDYNVFNGEKIIIELKNNKKVKFTSFEISDYYALTKQLRKHLHDNRTELNDMKDSAENKYEGYGWLVFILFLTLGLVYALIKQRLKI